MCGAGTLQVSAAAGGGRVGNRAAASLSVVGGNVRGVGQATPAGLEIPEGECGHDC